MLRHWVVNAAALDILTFRKFSRVIRMPRHWVVNAAALGILTSTIFFLNVNAAALGNECCGIGVSAKMNAVTFMPECCGIEPFSYKP